MVWKKISDSKVRHLWRCPECENEAQVHPDYYEVNGEPVCGDCDVDMEYDHTEVSS